MLECNVVLQSDMIAGYSLNRNDEEALKMHWQALMMGMRWKAFTFSTVLLIYANITAYDQGKLQILVDFQISVMMQVWSDNFEDFFELELEKHGYVAVYKNKTTKV